MTFHHWHRPVYIDWCLIYSRLQIYGWFQSSLKLPTALFFLLTFCVFQDLLWLSISTIFFYAFFALPSNKRAHLRHMRLDVPLLIRWLLWMKFISVPKHDFLHDTFPRTKFTRLPFSVSRSRATELLLWFIFTFGRNILQNDSSTHCFLKIDMAMCAPMWRLRDHRLKHLHPISGPQVLITPFPTIFVIHNFLVLIQAS